MAGFGEQFSGEAMPAGWRDEAVARALAASIGLHLILAAAIMAWPMQAPPGPASEAPIDVELLTPQQFQVETSDTAAARPIAAPPATAPANGMIRATAMLSAAALADPKSRAGRVVYAGLNGTEKMVQLCDLEAIEQIGAWRPTLKPERIVAYTTAPLNVDGDTIDAEGATFRSGARWYHLKFRCALSADGASVTAFEFRVGDPVPTDQLERLNLLVFDGE